MRSKQVYYAGIEKNPEMQFALCDCTVMCTWLVWGFAQWTSEQEKLLAQKRVFSSHVLCQIMQFV